MSEMDSQGVIASHIIVTSPPLTANLATVKLHINHTISTKGANYDVIDIKYFYLGTPLKEYKYACIPLTKIPDEIIK